MQTQKILEENTEKDLRKFLNRRSCINNFNLVLGYLYHIFQILGTLITTIGTTLNRNDIILLGVFFNSLAQLTLAIQKNNESVSAWALENIIKIKEGRYIDESIEKLPDKKSE